MIKYIIFDMDGVLINTEPIHYGIWRQICAERGITLDYSRYTKCIGSTLNYLFDLIEEWHGVSFRQDPTIRQRFSELKDRYLKENGLPPVTGAADAVKALYEKGFRMAVASSSSPEYIEYSMQTLDLKKYFFRLVSGEQVRHPKPAPDVFLEAARQLQADPAECLVVEDSRNGSLAAKAAGMLCLGFCNPDSGNQDLSAADAVFHDFSELPEHPLLEQQ